VHRWALTGHEVSSIAANPFGVVAVLVAFLLIVRPRWRQVSIPLWVLVGCAAVSWGWELRRFGFL
jgi:hypothetical protein